MFGRLASALWLGLLPSVALAIWSCGGGAQPGPTPPPPVEASPPGVPQNVRVRDRGADFVEWQWDPVSGAAGYQVQVSVGDDDFDPPDEEAVLPANETAAEFRDPELAPGTVVHLRVRAFAGSAGSPVYGPFSPTVPALVAGSPATDRMALEAFFAATGGPDWSDNTAWLSSAPLSEWHGVLTDADGRVTALDLWGNGLTGRIPPELGQLTNLTDLVLGAERWLFDCLLDFPGGSRRNELRGEIPPELGELSGLTTLVLGGLDLSGEIPPELGQLTNLTTLVLGGLDLSGEIPPELGGMTRLAVMRLNGNRLSGRIPPELGDLSRLMTLDLGDDREERCTQRPADPLPFPPSFELLTGEIPPELGRLANLRTLDLASNGLTGEIPPELGELMNLESLRLANNALSGAIPPELGQLANLRTLNLDNNLLSGAIPPELGRLTSLAWLSLSYNHLVGAIPESFLDLGLGALEILGPPGLYRPRESSVCAPPGPRFSAWLASIEYLRPSPFPRCSP